jgi:membrane-associated protease RseP (regulator of RpoE activity)
MLPPSVARGFFFMSDNPRFEHVPDSRELSAADRMPYLEQPPVGSVIAGVAERPKKGIATNLILFVATIFTTIFAGAFLAEANPIDNPWLIYKGIPFSFAIMSILLSHELGHYLMSRYHRVEATLPFFIPAPTLIGTFGAVIKMKSRVPDRRALLDIGASGPIVGFVVSIPFLIIGLKFSEIRGGAEGGEMFFGTSLLLEFMSRFLFPTVPEGHAVYLHPVALAGWLGLLVTMMNLLPMGSMDGGHIAYALFGKWHYPISFAFAVLLLTTGVVGTYMGLHGLGVWGVWGMVNLFIGLRHPPPVKPEIRLDGKRKLVAALAVLIFILTFVPMPVSY